MLLKNVVKNENVAEKMLSKKSKKYFSRPKNFRKKTLEKSMKNENFENSKIFRKMFEFSKFSFFIDFSKVFFSENFSVSKNIFRFFRQNFFILKKYIFVWIFFYINPKFSKDSKKHTYKIVRAL